MGGYPSILVGLVGLSSLTPINRLTHCPSCEKAPTIWAIGSVMALVGANGAAVPGLAKKHQKVAPPTQDIAPCFHSSSTTVGIPKMKTFFSFLERSFCFDTLKSAPSKTITFF